MMMVVVTTTTTIIMMIMIMIMIRDFSREIEELKQEKMYKHLGIEERIHKEIKNDTEIWE